MNREITEYERRLPDVESGCSKKLLSDYEQRALTLDLVHACWPQGHHPPAALTALLKTMLKLSDDHRIGGWPLNFTDEDGHVRDGRGRSKQDSEHDYYAQWLAAISIEQRYITDLVTRKEKELHPPKELAAEDRERALAELESEFDARKAKLKKSKLTRKEEHHALVSKYWAKREDIEGKGLPLTTAEFREHVAPMLPMSESELLSALQEEFPQSAVPPATTLRGWRQRDKLSRPI